MATLHIEHAITGDQYIDVQLDFGDTRAAEEFLQFLRTVVWASPEASPGLAGSPTGRVLTVVTPDLS